MPHIRLCVLLSLPILLLGGCGEAPPPVTVVTGRVTIEGRPLPRVRVEFIPEQATGAKFLRSMAVTDGNGQFELTCDDGRLGAVKGWHKVVIAPDNRGTHRDRNPFEPEHTKEAVVDEPTVPARYMSVNTTPERFEVKTGVNEATIRIKGS